MSDPNLPEGVTQKDIDRTCGETVDPNDPEMEEIKEFTIDRAVWLRGEGEFKSKLYRVEDGKMCCLGIYLCACGIDKSLLANRATPEETETQMPAWLIDSLRPMRSSLASKLITVNDIKLDEDKREETIKELFAEAGIKVTFKGE